MALDTSVSNLVMVFAGKSPSIDELLKFCTENKCSDLYIKVDSEPYISRYGKIIRIPCKPTDKRQWNEWSAGAISSEMNARYVREKMLDTSYIIRLGANQKPLRYRVSVGFSGGKNIATFRMISVVPPSFTRLQFPKQVEEALRATLQKTNGITVLAGPTGSGKAILHSQPVTIRSREDKELPNGISEGV